MKAIRYLQIMKDQRRHNANRIQGYQLQPKSYLEAIRYLENQAVDWVVLDLVYLVDQDQQAADHQAKRYLDDPDE